MNWRKARRVGAVVTLFAFNLAGAEPNTATRDAIDTLILQGERSRQAGCLHEAEAAFRGVLSAAEQLAEPRAEALATGLLGNVYLLQRRYATAKPLLEQALQASERHFWPGLAALQANYLGNLHADQRQIDRARRYYEKSLAGSVKAGDQALIVQATLNLARLAKAEEDADQAWRLLKEGHAGLAAIDSISDRTALALQTGYEALTLEHRDGINETARIELVNEALNTALDLALKYSDQRSESLAKGYQAQLYESRNRAADALTLTGQAADIAQRIDAKDLLLQWEWQRGRLLKAMGKLESALAAYRRAVDHIQAIRQDIPVVYHQGRSSFRETLEPVYQGLADLLLQQGKQVGDEERRQILRETRQTVELLKRTELEDYFHNRCAFQSRPAVRLEEIAPKTATIYPILLPDRLELLLSIGAEIYQRTVPVVAPEVRKKARSYAKRLRRRMPAYQGDGRQLYDWLIAPLETLLIRHEIDTLVIVPDGELRLVPLAALFDGEAYLIERYAGGTSPGLTLFDPQPLQRKEMSTLLAGLSRPGPVIKELPLPQLQRLVYSVMRQSRTRPSDVSTRGSGALDAKSRQTVPTIASLSPQRIQVLLNDPLILEKSQRALSLPGVEKEINTLAKLLPSSTLVDEHFVGQRLHEEILKAPYRVVHIASHGYFGHSSEQSFVMTYDQVLTMDELETLLLSDKIGESPIELLTLSACQTAEGDDRSPLGLSGMALKTNVRSVLGSLWPVSDEATVQLMHGFYRRLNSTDVSKARALQQAQIEVLRDRKRGHPFYWSPFILVGNWL